jgi:hypothetical protein
MLFAHRFTARASRAAGVSCVAALLAIAAAIASCSSQDPTECTAAKAGHGDAPTLTWTELYPQPPTGEGDCKLYARVIRNDEQLLAEYKRLKLAPQDPDAAVPEGGVEFGLPEVKWLKQSVVVYGSNKPETVTWSVLEGKKAILGVRGCSEGEGQCTEALIAVDAVIESADVYRCGSPGCTPPSNQ